MENQKPQLKFDIEIINKVDYNDLDTFVQNVLGFKDYEFACVQESGNDSSNEFNLDGKMREYDLKIIEEWKAGKTPNYSNRQVLNYLVSEGYLKPGNYLINVSW